MANDTRRAIARKSDYGTGPACVFCCLTLRFFLYQKAFAAVGLALAVCVTSE